MHSSVHSPGEVVSGERTDRFRSDFYCFARRGARYRRFLEGEGVALVAQTSAIHNTNRLFRLPTRALDAVGEVPD